MPRRSRRTRHHALHSTANQAPVARNILQDFVSTAPQGREYVRKAKRLAAYLNALRPLRPHILRRYLHRGNCYLLARSMSPDPSSMSALQRWSQPVAATLYLRGKRWSVGWNGDFIEVLLQQRRRSYGIAGSVGSL